VKTLQNKIEKKYEAKLKKKTKKKLLLDGEIEKNFN